MLFRVYMFCCGMFACNSLYCVLCRCVFYVVAQCAYFALLRFNSLCASFILLYFGVHRFTLLYVLWYVGVMSFSFCLFLCISMGFAYGVVCCMRVV